MTEDRKAEYMSLNDAIEFIMKRTGQTRRQAEQSVLQALKSGRFEARGVRVVTDPVTGEEEESVGPEPIPVEVWQDIPSQH